MKKKKRKQSQTHSIVQFSSFLCKTNVFFFVPKKKEEKRRPSDVMTITGWSKKKKLGGKML